MRAHITITLDYQAKVETLADAEQLGAAAREHLVNALSPELAFALVAAPTSKPVAVRRTVSCVRCERAFPALGSMHSTLGDGCACVIAQNEGEKIVLGMHGSKEFDLRLLRFHGLNALPLDTALCDRCVQKMLDDDELVDRQETY